MTYTMRRFELVAPHVRNDGSDSGYRDSIRDALALAGFTGWTESETVGYWHGKLESGTTFILYAENPETAETLGSVGRAAMPDQEAIQVVSYPYPVTLTEA